MRLSLASSIKIRPFSIGSFAICRFLDLHLVQYGEEGLGIDELDDNVAAYYFIHGAPIDDVCEAVRNGPKSFDDAVIDFTLAGFDPSDHRDRLIDDLIRQRPIIDAATVKVKPKKKTEAERKQEEKNPPPSNLIEPGFTASVVFTVSSEKGWSEHFVLWDLPLARALQYHHCALRSSLAWTVPAGGRSDDALTPERVESLETLEAAVSASREPAEDSSNGFDWLAS